MTEPAVECDGAMLYKIIHTHVKAPTHANTFLPRANAADSFQLPALNTYADGTELALGAVQNQGDSQGRRASRSHRTAPIRPFNAIISKNIPAAIPELHIETRPFPETATKSGCEKRPPKVLDNIYFRSTNPGHVLISINSHARMCAVHNLHILSGL
jgi:hypothetical protein